jgi:RHS repeat-associated protein
VQGGSFFKKKSGAGEKEYLYNGKELQEETGFYDFEARQYDPVIGRFTTIDPHAENSRRFSPFAYGENNPISMVDPDGMDATSDFKDKAGKLVAHINDGSNAVFTQTGSGANLHYEKTGYEQQEAGSVNAVTAKAVTSVIQEQQVLNNDNPALKQNAQGQGETHCNDGTCNVLNAVASALDNKSIKVNGMANDMLNQLSSCKNPNFAKADEQTAEENAANGGLSIGGTQENPHGHILTFSVGENIKKGKVANIGPKKYSGFTSVNGAISKYKPRSFFVLKQ